MPKPECNNIHAMACQVAVAGPLRLNLGLAWPGLWFGAAYGNLRLRA